MRLLLAWDVVVPEPTPPAPEPAPVVDEPSPVEAFALDLTTGDFLLRSAGHPPAIQLHAGNGRWTVHEGYEGAALGLLAVAAAVRQHRNSGAAPGAS